MQQTAEISPILITYKPISERVEVWTILKKHLRFQLISLKCA